MKDNIPKGKLHRTISSGKIVTKLGGNQLGYIIKKPFMSGQQRERLKNVKDKTDAKILFNGLTFLRGTALKAAQMLSLENGILPQSVCKELEKSYNQVPPVNRALVRRIISSNYKKAPEEVFKDFDSNSFAAASLGQVHRATSQNGEIMVLKIQYPDISKTIENDIFLLKGLLRPLSQYNILKVVLDEIKTVLLRETDYEQEAQNIRFFENHLKDSRVVTPKVYDRYTTKTILAMSFVEGEVLNKWLETDPDQESKNKVAQILHDIFIQGFYKFHRIHADPNPGNFLITDDLRVGLIDFGCVREFDPSFVRIYQDLIRHSHKNDRRKCLELLEDIKLINSQTDPEIKEQIIDLFMEMGAWVGRMFEEETFDFGRNSDFMEKGTKIGMKMQQFKNHIAEIRPEFIFLDRTRFGLIRLFEKMKVNIRVRNRYEKLAN